jgi:hypothetical protein
VHHNAEKRAIQSLENRRFRALIVDPLLVGAVIFKSALAAGSNHECYA